MKAEQVKLGELRTGAPFYTVDPIHNKHAFPRYAGLTDLPDDAEVWVCYESWSRYNPWTKERAEVQSPRDPLTGLMVGPDEWLR